MIRLPSPMLDPIFSFKSCQSVVNRFVSKNELTGFSRYFDTSDFAPSCISSNMLIFLDIKKKNYRPTVLLEIS